MLNVRIKKGKNIMLKEKQYSMEELKVVFQCNNRQQLKNKLTNYGVLFDDIDRGDQCIFDIKQITNPLKLFGVMEMHIPAQTDFNKFRNFCYCFLNDESFRNRPDTIKEAIMKQNGKGLARQTISRYESYLEQVDYVCMANGNYSYYFVDRYNNKYIETNIETYSEAWRNFYDKIAKKENSTTECFRTMRFEYGGLAKKYPKPEFNGIYKQQLNDLNDLVCAEMEKIIQFESDI